MTVISSNTLFHFTNSTNNIISILETGFSPRFCLEQFGPELFIGQIDYMETAIPMTCFCDIPLSQIENHLEFYGFYGIGLSKDWGQKNGVTPISYIHENSTQVKYLKLAGTTIFMLFKNPKLLDILPKDQNPLISIFELAAFFKQYKGKMWRNNQYVEKRFYDEREWRYVPFLNEMGAHYRLSKDQFLNKGIELAAANQMIAEKCPLKFKFSDIKYLIVKKESEMATLSDALDSMTNIYTDDQRKILKTKIISTEQIIEDF